MKIEDRELRIEDRCGSETGFRGSKIGIRDPGFEIGYWVPNCLDVNVTALLFVKQGTILSLENREFWTPYLATISLF